MELSSDLMEKELYADSIAYSYSGHQSLITGIYINCKIGEIVALLGRNGCGKSTLMKILFGIITPKNGLIRMNGHRVTKSYLTKEVCYLPQDRFLPKEKTVIQMINLMLNTLEKKERLKSDPLIQKILNQKIADLSVGEQRYLELRLLLEQEASFYLLDEPFSGVAPYLKDKIQEIILAYRDHKGFIISDHHYHSVLEVSSRMVLLQNGGCRVIKSKKELEMFYVPEGTFDE